MAEGIWTQRWNEICKIIWDEHATDRERIMARVNAETIADEEMGRRHGAGVECRFDEALWEEFSRIATERYDTNIRLGRYANVGIIAADLTNARRVVRRSQPTGEQGKVVGIYGHPLFATKVSVAWGEHASLTSHYAIQYATEELVADLQPA